MPIRAIVPMLTVPDVQAAVDAYAPLGFDLIEQLPGWACVARDGVELMFALPNAHIPFVKPAFTGSLYFQSTDVDALWLTLKDAATVVYPLEDFDYGMREFAIRDLNGYLLQFGEPIDPE